MKRFWALFSTVALIAILLALPRADAAPAVSFTALNDQLLPLSGNTIPIVRSGSVYLPSTVFNEKNIGISVSSKTASTLVLHGKQRMLTFDLNAGTASDAEATYTAQTVSSNGIIYVPAYFVSQYFGLEYSYLSTNYGTVVRVKNTDAALNDAAFIRNNTDLMEQYYAAYTQPTPKQTPKPTPKQTPKPSATVKPTQNTPAPTAATPKPTPTKTPQPATAPPPSPKPTATPSPTPTPVESSEVLPSIGQPTDAFLGVCLTDLERGKTAFSALGPWSKQICFFFSSDKVQEQGDLVRQVIGSGCQIGLYLPEDTTDGEAALQQGNQALNQVARTTTVLLACPSASAEQRENFRQAGYVLFPSNSVIGGHDSVTQCTAQIEQRISATGGAAYLLLDDAPGARNAILAQLKTWSATEKQLRQFKETSQ